MMMTMGTGSDYYCDSDDYGDAGERYRDYYDDYGNGSDYDDDYDGDGER